MKGETASIPHNKVWSLVDLLDGYRPIGCKWVFKTKCDAKGHVKPVKILNLNISKKKERRAKQ